MMRSPYKLAGCFFRRPQTGMRPSEKAFRLRRSCAFRRPLRCA
ncbi:anthranilate dioxygenase small subunit [Neisseria bacilliformis ATCC BAA-1200]|uniref:Anthranilate dioxygenase small subunit n=1 Tax=Neisseria bacilliformis ATCC BAA-1200 TaxID=888742 RepID=F2BG19_9NEIS|nr:anthranilate dioxygenase small subunit [Neisseria bacilliformis ATCC BAA-1200]